MNTNVPTHDGMTDVIYKYINSDMKATQNSRTPTPMAGIEPPNRPS
jgi:hypothetical protein